MTAAALADELEEAIISFVDSDGDVFQYNYLTILSREFGVFLPKYDNAMLNNLTDMFDNKGYDERRRKAGKRLSLENASITLFGACTPAYLNNTLPEGAWEEGFMSRTVVVYSGAMPPKPITEEAESHKNITKVINDLRKISDICGKVSWTKGGLEALNNWYLNGRKPAPTHPKLVTYNERRHLNAMKLAVIHAVARGSSYIEVSDFEDALALLLRTEETMPEAFKAMRTGGDQQAMKELWHFMYGEYMRKKQTPVPRALLVDFLSDRVPAHSVDRVIQVMTAAGHIKPAPTNAFIPVRRET
jgi:hypothetical protein